MYVKVQNYIWLSELAFDEEVLQVFYCTKWFRCIISLLIINYVASKLETIWYFPGEGTQIIIWINDFYLSTLKWFYVFISRVWHSFSILFQQLVCSFPITVILFSSHAKRYQIQLNSVWYFLKGLYDCCSQTCALHKLFLHREANEWELSVSLFCKIRKAPGTQ